MGVRSRFSTRRTRRYVRLLLVAAALLAALLRAGATPGPADRAGGPAVRGGEEMPHDANRAADSVQVRRVIDGDTVELSDGRMVRYIGIDTPESRRRVGGRWVAAAEPYSREATDANRRLVQGKAVRLERDVQPEDRYGRTLAYVYVAAEGGGDIMVNAELLRQGVAQLLTIPPNVRHVEMFRKVADEARRDGRGLWGASRAR